jgi:hypothetical protein
MIGYIIAGSIAVVFLIAFVYFVRKHCKEMEECEWKPKKY